MRSVFMVLLMVWQAATTAAEHTETLIDTQRPLRVVLGQAERLIRFDGPVAFASRDVSGQYRLGDYFHLNNLGANVLVDAKKPFPAMRVEVMRRDIEHRYLLDLAFAQSAAPMADLVITQRTPEPPAQQPVSCKTASCLSDPRARLIRFAAQWFYGPQSLVTPLPGISAQLTPAYANLRMPDGLQLKAVGRWYWRGFELDVMRVQNVQQTPIQLDPREFRGLKPGSMVSAQRWALDPTDRPGSSTLVYHARPESR
ncbi:MAG: DUF3438 family protein [Pseudomonadota bacterium]